jgi:hypothetical protein
MTYPKHFMNELHRYALKVLTEGNSPCQKTRFHRDLDLFSYEEY